MSGGSGHRRAPRPLALALAQLREELEPATVLARIQRAWPAAVGEAVAAAAQPVRERDGVLEVACESSVWAAELDLLGGDLVARLNGALGEQLVRGLRCRTR